MSDQTPEDQPDEQPPETDAHIRALLAQLGSGPHGTPMPAAVAARLDDSLARMVAERALPGSDGDAADEIRDHDADNVVPFRQRWLPRLTAAAAAVVVLGAGGVAASSLGVFGNDSHTMADSGASSSPGSSGAETSAPADARAPSPDPNAGADARQVTAVPALRSTTFGSDVTALLRSGRVGAGAPEDRAQAKQAPEALATAACPGPSPGDGAGSTLVQYDGRPAVLVVHPERAHHQRVEAWNCAGTQQLATTTVTP